MSRATVIKNSLSAVCTGIYWMLYPSICIVKDLCMFTYIVIQSLMWSIKWLLMITIMCILIKTIFIVFIIIILDVLKALVELYKYNQDNFNRSCLTGHENIPYISCGLSKMFIFN